MAHSIRVLAVCKHEDLSSVVAPCKKLGMAAMLLVLGFYYAVVKHQDQNKLRRKGSGFSLEFHVTVHQKR